VKHLAAQAAMKMHLSQPLGIGAFDGQQGISSEAWSSAAAADMACAMFAVGAASPAVAIIAGWANGTQTNPAITKAAMSRRMVSA
jgi:hypothetical protein